MDLFKRYATDETKELEGIKHFIGPGDEDYIKIARMGNDVFNAEFARLTTEMREQLESKDVEVQKEAQKELMVQTMARSIVTGWGKTMTYQGEPLEFSVENAIKVLRHKEFREDVFRIAQNVENYRLETQAKVAKN